MINAPSDLDSKRLESLYREEGSRLWRALLAFSGNPEVASDAISEAFAQAIASRTEIEFPRAWIWTVAFRLARAELKTHPKVAPIATSVSDDNTHKIDLLNAMGALSPKERASLLLHYYADYPVKEVAHIIGSSSGAVRVHLNRGRKKLKTLLGGDYA